MKPTVKQWQGPVNAIVGVWLILAPWSLGFEAAGAANAAIATAITIVVLAVWVLLADKDCGAAWRKRPAHQ